MKEHVYLTGSDLERLNAGEEPRGWTGKEIYSVWECLNTRSGLLDLIGFFEEGDSDSLWTEEQLQSPRLVFHRRYKIRERGRS